MYSKVQEIKKPNAVLKQAVSAHLSRPRALRHLCRGCLSPNLCPSNRPEGLSTDVSWDFDRAFPNAEKQAKLAGPTRLKPMKSLEVNHLVAYENMSF